MTENSLRFVLSWENAPKDLGIHMLFQVSRNQKCEVYFARKECVGASLDIDNLNGGQNGVETITVNTLGNYIYTVAINKYVDITDGIAPGENDVREGENNQGNNNRGIWANIPLVQAKAKVSVYAPGYSDPILVINNPPVIDDSTVYGSQSNSPPDTFDWWIVFCLDGSKGIDSIVTVNKYKISKPIFKDCSDILAENSQKISASATGSLITFGR